MEGDKVTEKKINDVTTSRAKGMASIKAEFLKKLAERAPKDGNEPSNKKIKLDSENPDSVKKANSEEKPADSRDRNDRGPRRKGQNKKRAKFSSQRADRKDRLCSAILHDVECTYGDKCKFSHDLNTFMKNKPADIGTECVHFKLKGFCNFSFACRFAESHVQKIDGILKNIKSSDSRFSTGPQYSCELNKFDKEVLFKLRKRKYDFSKASAIHKETLKLVAEFVKSNIKKYSTKLTESDLKEELMIMSNEETAKEQKNPEQNVFEQGKAAQDDSTTNTQPPSSVIVTTRPIVADAASTMPTEDEETKPRTENLETKTLVETNGDVEKSTSYQSKVTLGENLHENTTSACNNGQTTSTEAVQGETTAASIIQESATSVSNIGEKATPSTNEEETVPADEKVGRKGATLNDVHEKTNKDGIAYDKEIPIGCITNEDQIKLRPTEKKTIDFRNKLYLAPLTTVGNLPFRRVCKEFGAEITCGEMALATKILQGTATELALCKRHESEDIFGVQICGAYSDSMANCTQLLNETCSLDFIDINVGCPIDMIYDMGAGSALMRRSNRFQEIVRSMVGVSTIPITAKIRTGISANKNTAHNFIPKLKGWGISLITLHGRSREQRYTREADWRYINECAQLSAPVPFYGGGDILNYEDYNAAMKTSIDGTMIARGALIKPWIFTEIKEQRHWDISSNERLDILKKFTDYGLEHWGSDSQGVETTRRFLLEWLSFLHRYIPVGLLERVPNKINERPAPYIGRNDLETLMSSSQSVDWVKISEMLLGKVPEGFFFVPKHRANSYEDQTLSTV